jgi:hypothetical protein
MNLLVCLFGSLFPDFGGVSGGTFHGSLETRPSGGPWDDKFGVPYGGLGSSIGQAIGLPTGGCEFGACGAGPMGFTDGQGGPDLNNLIYQGDLWGIAKYFWSKRRLPYSDPTDSNHRLFGTHYCGPGGGGAPTGGLDILCAAHDACYRANGVSAIDNLNPFTSGSAMGGCDRLLCMELGQYHPKTGQEAVGKNQVSQIFGCGYINR